MTSPRRTLIAALAGLTGLALIACTPEDVQRWHELQPPAAPPAEPTVWDRLAECESGGNWSINSKYDGGLQFHPSTWRGNGGTEFAEFAWQASREQQIVVAERVRESQGWRAWPSCSRRLGLR